MAIDNTGILTYAYQKSGYTSEDFSAFIEQLTQEIISRKIIDACIIFDNCPCHKEDDFQDIFEYHDCCDYNFLPPYSPFLNPIEECINDIKCDIKGQLSYSRKSEVLSIAGLPWGQKARARGRLLKSCLKIAISNFKAEKAAAHIQHSMSFLPGCLNFADL